jgi:hypothetical protein
MKTSTRLYGWLKVVTVLHIAEQLIFGMQDLHQLQRMRAVYESCFANKNIALALLVTISAGLGIVAICCIVKGGFARFITMFVLGLPTIGEVHHLLDTLRAGRYTPGTVTAIPSILCGVLFLRALVNEYRPSKSVRVREIRQLPVAA